MEATCEECLYNTVEVEANKVPRIQVYEGVSPGCICKSLELGCVMEKKCDAQAQCDASGRAYLYRIKF